ncbi:hypothetical protein ACFPAF_11620 [Hymenobacter endophyticus]|uniref:DUF4890 domain-containing protein n=1 Tax=Hymenobacter endophyticus TaxID=3076335 RepID=A0ABU3TI54_9BACT|nr:hypothetical protein [Hymenobacter endophyticus]MDU0371046.1 hypothetical protein [Hymenobacter endophyticus]
MKKQLLSLALLLGLIASASEASLAAPAIFGQAQRQDDRHDKDGRQGRKGQRQDGQRQDGQRQDGQRRQQRLDQMAKDLDLSSKQKSKVEKIFQDQQQQMQALRGQSGGKDRSQRMADFKRIHEGTDKKLKDVLSKKQYAQFETKRQERMRQMQSRQGGERRGGPERRDFNGRG